MARIRTVKPEMRRSLTVSSWPIPVRWTFVGLICYLDDHGRALDDLRLIKAELYPLDDSVTIRKIDQHLATITDHGPLCRYNVAGQGYMHVVSWAEHQRVDHPTASRIPPCPLHEASRGVPEPLANGSRNVPEPFGASRVRAEQGREGKGKEGIVSGLGSQSAVGRTNSANGGPDGLDRIAAELRQPRAWAERVRRDVLSRAGPVSDPTAYVLAAIRGESHRYQPTSGPPPIGRICDHGRDRLTCHDCNGDTP